MGNKGTASKKGHVQRDLKFIIVGDPGVGKLSLAERYYVDEFSSQHTHMSPDDLDKTIEIYHRNTPLKFTFATKVNTGGEDPYQGRHAVLIAFSLASEESFKNLPKWVNECHRFAPDAHKILVGTKCDEKHRVVEAADIDQFIKENDMRYFETSSKQNVQVAEAFHYLFRKIFNSMDPQDQKAYIDPSPSDNPPPNIMQKTPSALVKSRKKNTTTVPLGGSGELKQAPLPTVTAPEPAPPKKDIISILISGEPMTGKMALAECFYENQFNNRVVSQWGEKKRDYEPEPIFIDLQVNGETVSMKCRTTAACSSYYPPRGRYPGKDIVFITYAITSFESFLQCQKWLIECERYAPSATRILVGTKFDLPETKFIHVYWALKNINPNCVPMSGTGTLTRDSSSLALMTLTKRTKKRSQDPGVFNATLPVEIIARIALYGVERGQCPREVSYEQAKEWADEHDMPFLETSAKTNMNITKVFELACATFLKAGPREDQ